MVIFIIGNKGGIGKTTISAYIAEYLKKNNKELLCFDTDPENNDFLSYKELGATRIAIKNATTNNIDKSAFDILIEAILNNKDKNIVIDNGAGSFNPLINYLAENDILNFLKSENVETMIVGIGAGAGNTEGSVNGLRTLLDNFDTNFLIFHNELFGNTEYKGKRLTDLKMVKQEKVKGIIEIPELDEYQRKDIQNFTKHRMLFSDLAKNEDFKMMQKRRLMNYRDGIFGQLEQYLKV